MSLTYRAATAADLDLLTAMHIRLRADERMDNVMTDDEVRLGLAKGLAGTCIALLFYEKSGTVVGYTLTDHVRKPIYLHHLYVKDEFRRRGCGEEMMRLTLRHFQAAQLDLDVMTWNEGARAFYRKLGCRERYLGLRYKPDP